MIHHGTGQHRMADKRKQSEQIAADMAKFLRDGGKVKRLEAQQLRPIRHPVFNTDPHKWGIGEDS